MGKPAAKLPQQLLAQLQQYSLKARHSETYQHSENRDVSLCIWWMIMQ
jgi:hypothetical protein